MLQQPCDPAWRVRCGWPKYDTVAFDRKVNAVALLNAQALSHGPRQRDLAF
jgi:hypothetical protein